MYGVLGLDPITPKENEGNKRESKSSNQSNLGLRAYGLTHKLFLTENQGHEAKNDFDAKIKMINAEKKYNMKKLEYQQALAI